MNKLLITLVTMFTISSFAYASDDIDMQIKIATAIAKAKVEVLGKSSVNAYVDARLQAIKENKTLVVWIGHNNPSVSKDLSDCIQVNVGPEVFNRGKDKEVLVGKPINGELWIVPDVDVADSALNIKTKVNSFNMSQGFVNQVISNSPSIMSSCPNGNCSSCANGQCGQSQPTGFFSRFRR